MSQIEQVKTALEAARDMAKQVGHVPTLTLIDAALASLEGERGTVRASAPEAPEDVAGLVERLSRLVIMDEVGSDNPLGREAASALTRLAAERDEAKRLHDEKMEEVDRLANLADAQEGRAETAEAEAATLRALKEEQP